MAANPINAVAKLHAVQYDGTNSGDIAALDPGFDFNNDTENAGVWTFQSPPDSTLYVVNTGNWIVYSQGQVFYVKTENEYDREWDCNITCSDLNTTLQESAPTVQAMGVAAVPALLLSGSANVDVTLQPAMPDSSYTAYASKFAGVSLTDLQINSVTVVDEDTVTVNVSNVGLLTIAGASVLVHAVA